MYRITTRLVLASLFHVVAFSASGQEVPRPRSERAERGRARVAELEQRVAALEQELAALRAEVADLKPDRAAIVAGNEVKVFPLRHSDAAAMARLLTQLLGKEGQVRVVADERTNSVIAAGSGEQLLTVEALLMRLDDSEAPGIADELRQSLRQQAGLQAVELNAWLAQAEADVRKRQEHLEHAKRLLEKGYVTKLQVEAERAGLDAARAVLEQARAALEALAEPARTTAEPLPE